MLKKTYYITTPIYYPSDKLHVGHSYTTVAADAMARFKRLLGYDVWFLTGTDEHGLKIQRSAENAGKTPQLFVDGIVAGIKNLWAAMDISYDDFIRTTEPRHKQVVQGIFDRLYRQGDIYKGRYEGWYCTPCESFWTARQVDGGNCPDCGRPVELVAEDGYFFRMSKYADRLLEHINNNPDFIQPPSRKNEMINNFLRPGLEDLCVSRATFDWGIQVPFDGKYVIYVWLDALSNYITALGYTKDETLFHKYWPADVHLMAKEIVRFHAIYWPIFLMALDLPLPKQIFGHGWLIMKEGKMSKSKGNVVDPMVLLERYSSDSLRYYLLREISFGQDGVFSNESMLQRINTDLANDLGNLLSRTMTMMERFFDGIVPAPADGKEEKSDQELRRLALEMPSRIEKLMDELQFNSALETLWALVRRSNKYIDENAPWLLAKKEEKRERLGTVLYNLCEALRFISILLLPYMPRTPRRIWSQLGIETMEDLHKWDSLQEWGLIKPGTKAQRKADLFPRLDIKKELASLLERKTEKEKTGEKTQAPAGKPKHVSIEEFARLEVRVGEIVSAEPVPKTDKLLKLEVNLGQEKRQVVAGIALHYTPQELIGKKVLFLANLKPAKIRGLLSEGMILAATDPAGKVVLTAVDGDVPAGSKIS
ncbi:MAG: methionine--tRNA ligase [Firmicutes bacterium]|nr:methionine--tRNA ligase [Bacillota bacterium]